MGKNLAQVRHPLSQGNAPRNCLTACALFFLKLKPRLTTNSPEAPAALVSLLLRLSFDKAFTRTSLGFPISASAQAAPLRVNP